MVLAIEAGHLHVDHRIAMGAAVLHGLDDPLLHRRDVLPGDGTADDLVDEAEPGTALERLDADGHPADLAVAAGLLLVLPLRLDPRGDRLAERGEHLFDLHLHAELASQP